MRRHRYAQRQGGGSGSLILVVILVLAVAAGYGGTKYFIVPYVLEGRLWSASQEDPSGVPDTVTTGPGVVSGQQQIKDAPEADKNTASTKTSGGAVTTETALANPPAAPASTEPPAAPSSSNVPTALTGKFAVQFGSFSSQGAADKAVSELAAKKITASVLQQGTSYKVIGTPFSTKEAARAEAERLRPMVEDVYVTAI